MKHQWRDEHGGGETDGGKREDRADGSPCRSQRRLQGLEKDAPGIQGSEQDHDERRRDEHPPWMPRRPGDRILAHPYPRHRPFSRPRSTPRPSADTVQERTPRASTRWATATISTIEPHADNS